MFASACIRAENPGVLKGAICRADFAREIEHSELRFSDSADMGMRQEAVDTAEDRCGVRFHTLHVDKEPSDHRTVRARVVHGNDAKRERN